MSHGSEICSLCYEQPGDVAPGDYRHRRIGKLFYFRSHSEDREPSAQLRLDLIPAKAWADGIDLFVGNFVPSEKVPEPVYVEGDLMAATEDRGDHVNVGYVQTVQNPDSRKAGEYEDQPTQYHVKLKGLPVAAWKRLLLSDKETKSLYLKVKM